MVLSTITYLLYLLSTTMYMSCHEQPWNLQQQLLEYCWLDVDVLAKIVKKFSDAHLNFGNIPSDTNT